MAQRGSGQHCRSRPLSTAFQIISDRSVHDPKGDFLALLRPEGARTTFAGSGDNSARYDLGERRVQGSGERAPA